MGMRVIGAFPESEKVLQRGLSHYRLKRVGAFHQ
jgi:hypothetical protein